MRNDVSLLDAILIVNVGDCFRNVNCLYLVQLDSKKDLKAIV